MTMQPSDETLSLGNRAARGILGVDRIYRDESGDDFGLACLDMSRPGELESESFADYSEATEWWTEFQEDAQRLPEADRRLYYAQLAVSTRAFIEWRTSGLDFERQLGDFLHVPAAPAADAEIAELCTGIRGLLDGMGFHGDLRAQAQAWEERVTVPPEDVPDVLNGLLAEAWERTNERVFPIPADPSDGMRAEAVRDVAYNARCDYLARTIQLNVDPILTRPGLKHLAVHEGYPGHYLQFKLRETWARSGEAPQDVLLSVVNTASSSVFEGIADAGLDVVGWNDGDEDRLQGLLTRHRAAIGTGAAWRLHALGRPRDEVKDWLAGQALIGGDGWVENRLRFIEAPSRAVLIWSYWWGEQAVAPAWNSIDPARVHEFVYYLYGRMHSVDSVRLFPG